jgi:ankyrin repeat protein
VKKWANAITTQYDNWTALHLACKDRNDMFMYLLKELGADPNARNKNGLSLMHKAAIDNNNYILTYLRDVAGLKIDETDYDGNTPLHYACNFGANYSTFWLLGFGQDPNV